MASEREGRLNLHAEFVLSSPRVDECPEWDLPEYAFIGRSNVGKSSLINKLVGKKDLAKTSGRPGKTQLINLFKIDRGTWVLADLPGYGYAKVSKTQRAAFSAMIGRYVRERKNLALVFVLIDSRLEPQTIDLEFLNWCGEEGVPFVVAFTKADKQSKTQTDRNVKLFLNKLIEIFGDTPDYFVTSAEKGQGKNEILHYLAELVSEFESQRTN